MPNKRLVVVVALIVLIFLLAVAGKAAAPLWHTSPLTNASASKNVHPSNSQSFDLHAYSTSSPDSKWIVVNKQHPLDPKTYVPSHLEVPPIPLRSNISGDEKLVSSAMSDALVALVHAAFEQGVHLNLQSGYRSYSFQTTLYNGYVRTQGQASADRQSARPGYSEHQTGLAADLGGTSKPSCNVAQCFADTVEGKWLAEHAYEYGFLIRYTSDKESITGYEFEPWHVRYVDTGWSNEMHKSGIKTLEELFNISGGTQYN